MDDAHARLLTMIWPQGRRFAFTVFADPDSQTLQASREVYALLSALGFRTTKGVWRLPPRRTASDHGVTCGERGYVDWLLGLREGHPYFWGDLCRQHVTYLRNFVYSDINTLRACPWMPYHDPARPFVNFWYASSEGSNVNSFVTTLDEANQDRLEEEGGLCIMYAHFGHRFCDDGRLDPRFRRLMERLRSRKRAVRLTSRRSRYLAPGLMQFGRTPAGAFRLRPRATLER